MDTTTNPRNKVRRGAASSPFNQPTPFPFFIAELGFSSALSAPVRTPTTLEIASMAIFKRRGRIGDDATDLLSARLGLIAVGEDLRREMDRTLNIEFIWATNEAQDLKEAN